MKLMKNQRRFKAPKINPHFSRAQRKYARKTIRNRFEFVEKRGGLREGMR
jgi:hypothetical protein